jgi:hypothetical protein
MLSRNILYHYIRYSRYDVLGMSLRRDLVRRKFVQ